jgi:predicted PurR-regulated permease PerM
MKGQISAEMLIILAIVVAIALLVATQLIGMAQETTETVEEGHEKINTGVKDTIENTDFAPIESHLI